MGKTILSAPKETCAGTYPAVHWTLLRRFLKGDELDPKKYFKLADDSWKAHAYANNVYPPHAYNYTFSFKNLRSWIKPYVKLYSFERLMGRKGCHSTRDAKIAYHLTRVDQFIIDRGLRSLDDFADPSIFEALWEAQLLIPENSRAPYTVDMVRLQKRTRAFWLYIQSVFGVPFVVPPVAPHTSKPLTDSGADVSKLIPDAVVRQLVNILALHRDGVAVLTPYDHLRLCVLLLQICVGRRIEEVFASPRGEGPDGSLQRYPCRTKDGAPGEALWFRFTPNKNGLSDWVYISPEWEDLATYCVRNLAGYSDAVRQLAAPEERNLLILVSRINRTAPPTMKTSKQLGAPEQAEACLAAGLSHNAFSLWLNGCSKIIRGELRHYPGFLEERSVTCDGSPESKHYHMKTSYARHTRQSILAGDPRVSLLSRHRDLNHNGRDEQFTYQHVLDEENSALSSKMMDGSLLGRSMQSLDELLGITPENSVEGSRPMLVTILTPRMQELIDSNPQYFERNEVDLGTCSESGGREDCEQYASRPKRVRSQGKGKNLSIDVGNEVNSEGAESRKEPSSNLEVAPVRGGRDRAINTDKSKAVVERLKTRVLEIEEGKL